MPTNYLLTSPGIPSSFRWLFWCQRNLWKFSPAEGRQRCIASGQDLCHHVLAVSKWSYRRWVVRLDVKPESSPKFEKTFGNFRVWLPSVLHQRVWHVVLNMENMEAKDSLTWIDVEPFVVNRKMHVPCGTNRQKSNGQLPIAKVFCHSIQNIVKGIPMAKSTFQLQHAMVHCMVCIFWCYKVGPKSPVINGVTWDPYKWPEING